VLSAPEITELYLGKFVKAFGIKGELKFLGSDDFWGGVLASEELVVQRLADGELEQRPLRIERFRPHGGTFVVKVEGIDDRNAAEAEVGSEVFIDLDRLDVELPEEELPYQVLGFAVKLEDGSAVGTVTSLVFSVAHNVYEVTGDDGVVLIPAIPEFVVARDEEKAEITIRPIPGLIDG